MWAGLSWRRRPRLDGPAMVVFVSVAHVAHANVVPGLLNGSHLLVEINELDQLLLQDFLPADGAFDEVVLQQVQHVGSQLEVLDQAPARSRSSAPRGKQR